MRTGWVAPPEPPQDEDSAQAAMLWRAMDALRKEVCALRDQVRRQQAQITQMQDAAARRTP